MESIEEPLQSQDDPRVIPKDHDAMDNFEPEMEDINPASKVADSSRNSGLMKGQSSEPPSNYPGDCRDARSVVKVEEGSNIQSNQQHHEQEMEREVFPAKASSTPSALRSNAEDVVTDHPSIRRPSFARAETSYNKPTKASRGRQVAKTQDSPGIRSFWKPPGSSRPESPYQSRPGTAQPSRPETTHQSATARANDQTKFLQHDKGGRGFQSPGLSPLMHEDKVLQDDTSNETQLLAKIKTAATETDTEATRLIDSLRDKLRAVQFEKISERAAEYSQDKVDSATIQTDEISSPSRKDFRSINSDMLSLCEAWTNACTAAQIPHAAAAAFRSLLTDSTVDEVDRTALHHELGTNSLCTWIHEAQARIQHLEREREDALLHAFIAEHTLGSKTSQPTAKPQRRQRWDVFKEDLGTRAAKRPIYVDRAVQWKPVPESIQQLKERLRKQREIEEANEALKEKVRDMQIESVGLRTKRGGKYAEEQAWFVRWRGDAYWDRLTEEERKMADQL